VSTNSLFCLSEAGSPPLVVLWSLIEGGGHAVGSFSVSFLSPRALEPPLRARCTSTCAATRLPRSPKTTLTRADNRWPSAYFFVSPFPQCMLSQNPRYPKGVLFTFHFLFKFHTNQGIFLGFHSQFFQPNGRT